LLADLIDICKLVCIQNKNSACKKNDTKDLTAFCKFLKFTCYKEEIVLQNEMHLKNTVY